MKVLIVDDEVIVARALSRAFQIKGHEVTVAHSGEEGLGKWQTLAPQIVMLDVVMPGLTGPQVIEEYRQENAEGLKRTCVVLMTAHSGIKGREMAREMGADEFVQKPFDNVFTMVEHIQAMAEEKTR